MAPGKSPCRSSQHAVSHPVALRVMAPHVLVRYQMRNFSALSGFTGSSYLVVDYAVKRDV